MNSTRLLLALWSTSFPLLSASFLPAATLHHWRFEPSPGFGFDSAGGANLAGSATPSPIPASGRGSTFDDAGNPATTPNTQAADFNGFLNTLTTTYTPLTGDFTVEAFIHPDSVDANFGNMIVASHTGIATQPSLLGFSFQLRNDGQAAAPGTLMLTVSQGNTDFNFNDPGIVILPGNDYYVAASFDLAGGQFTYYAQNLTAGTPLETATTTHNVTALNPISSLSVGNSLGGSLSDQFAFDGLIDELRISNTVLTPEELLIVPEPSTGLLALGSLALFALRRRR